MLRRGDKIALVVNSNGISREAESDVTALVSLLKEIGLVPVLSAYMYQAELVYSGSPSQRGNELNAFWRDGSIKAIFDMSGGDIANQVLPYLDYDLIKKKPKPFFGYSDLTTILNSLYSQSGIETYLYQVRNLIWDQTRSQKKAFVASLLEGQPNLFQVNWQFNQGELIQGTVIGGNIRCFLKLAGTPYLPDFQKKVLFLESQGGDVPQLTTYLNQLSQMGVFKQISGLLLGTFTELERKSTVEISQLVKAVIGNPTLPIASTTDIGHGIQSKCLIIGKEITIQN